MLQISEKLANRASVCKLLRETPIQQCQGSFGIDTLKALNMEHGTYLSRPPGSCAQGIVAINIFQTTGVNILDGVSSLYMKGIADYLHISGDDVGRISRMNDQGSTFSEIADWIEALP